MITEEEYIKTRIDDQIAWYNNKARLNKKWNFRVKQIVIIISAMISVIAGFTFSKYDWLKSILLGSFGAIIAVSSGISDLMKYAEKWTQYRTTAEALTQEKMHFCTLSGPYKEITEPFKTFVERTEAIITKEYSTWSQYVNQEKEKKA